VVSRGSFVVKTDFSSTSSAKKKSRPCWRDISSQTLKYRTCFVLLGVISSNLRLGLYSYSTCPSMHFPM